MGQRSLGQLVSSLDDKMSLFALIFARFFAGLEQKALAINGLLFAFV
jgi:hypothetical protein